MSSPLFLLVDFGASHTKAAIADLDTKKIDYVHHYPSLKNCSSASNRYEISTTALHAQFLTIADFYYHQLRIHFKGILLCSQMHGFILLNENQQPLSHYISWQDERSLEKIDGQSTFDLITQTFGERFKLITGMQARPGFPYMNALHYLKQLPAAHKKSCKMISLPEWIALCHQDSRPVSHITLQTSLGFYGIEKKCPAKELVDFFEEHAKTKILFNETAEANQVAGYYHESSAHKIPIYVGVGDFQCALLGANIRDGVISINIGTGSQVSRLNYSDSKSPWDIRPFFNGNDLSTQTHIPAGRALNEYLNFLIDVCQHLTGKSINPWGKMESIVADTILNSTLDIDLNIFKSAFRYTGGGEIIHVHEKTLTTENYLASLLKNLLLQYHSVAVQMNKDDGIKQYILSGGIARKLPNLVSAFREITQKEVSIASAHIDETFLGLQLLALTI